MRDINESLFRGINDLGFDYPFLNMPFIIIAEYTVIFLALMVLFFWFTRNKQNRYKVLAGGFAFILAWISGNLIGLLHHNYQPFYELEHVNQLVFKNIDNSFPSDHTILFFAFCVTFWLFNKRNIAWLILAILVGLSRMAVGVHYPFDILVGAAVAIIFAYVMYKWVPRSKLVNTCLEFYEHIEVKVWPKKDKQNQYYS
ncbi:undecaprenyl-diphosphatase [Alkalihalobacillus pseudalcaliphilus]|uniref:undecaprenyl-diphosphatase n=1 Tax=Alkalihalobacillus pseudalcaliphilus TaxID=79884 RepID=UPI00064D943F|nr:undecaprenyl-diphosphatase [Alkalihalobacillus pseudalcaliphilus]KMK78113.1 bacitracin ABC transporter permease [Alkalihalobacillus pseudalcaliphilus]